MRGSFILTVFEFLGLKYSLTDFVIAPKKIQGTFFRCSDWRSLANQISLKIFAVSIQDRQDDKEEKILFCDLLEYDGEKLRRRIIYLMKEYIHFFFHVSPDISS